VATIVLKYGVLNKYFQKLANIPLSTARIVEGTVSDGAFLSDLKAEDELILQSTRKALFFLRSGVRCKISLMVREPMAIQKGLYIQLRFFWWKFHRVLTHSDYIMRRLPNAERWFHGGILIDPDAVGQCNKTARLSIISSNKRSTEGHIIRHQLIDWARYNRIDINVFGHGYNPLESKIEGHRSYCFSVVVENSSSAGYFSEQILDCMLCETVPIYWGDPEITNFFDGEGIIICRNLQELKDTASRVQMDDYQDYLEVIRKNKERALASLDYDKCIWRISRNELP